MKKTKEIFKSLGIVTSVIGFAMLVGTGCYLFMGFAAKHQAIGAGISVAVLILFFTCLVYNERNP